MISGIIEHLLEISGALVIGSCKGIAAVEKVFTEYHLQTPRPDDFNGRHDLRIRQGNLPGQLCQWYRLVEDREDVIISVSYWFELTVN